MAVRVTIGSKSPETFDVGVYNKKRRYCEPCKIQVQTIRAKCSLTQNNQQQPTHTKKLTTDIQYHAPYKKHVSPHHVLTLHKTYSALPWA